MIGFRFKIALIILILIMSIFASSQSVDPQYQRDELSANHDYLWLPASLISSENYQDANEAIDSLIPFSLGKTAKWEISDSTIIEFALTDLLLLQKGYAYHKRGLFSQAIGCYDKITGKTAILKELKNYLTANAYFQSKGFDDAAIYAARYIQDNPGGIFYSELIAISAERDFSKANYLVAAEKFKEAAECENDPAIASSFYLRAAESFKYADMRNKSYDCYLDLARLCGRNLLRDSIYTMLPQDNREFARKVGFLLYQRRLNRTAIQYLREISPDDSLIFLEGLCRQRMGQYQTARRLFLSIKMNSPFAAELLPKAKFHAAISAYLNKDYAVAIREMRDFINNYQGHPLMNEASAFEEIFELHKEDKPREVINYIYGLPSPDRKFNIQEVLLFGKSWKAFDQGRYHESCSLFIALQNSNARQPKLNEGLFWALQAGKMARRPERIELLESQLADSERDLFHSAAARLSPNQSLLEQADFFGDSIAIRKTLVSFSEKWHRFSDEINVKASISSADNARSLTILTFDLGFENLGLSLLAKIGNRDSYPLGEIIGIMDYLLRNDRIDEFYELARRKIDELNQIGNADFILYSPLYFNEVYSSAIVNGIDPYLLWALIKNESLFDPKIESYAGALGLMQLMPKTARATARKINLRLRDLSELENPATNIQIGTAYLADLITLYDGNLIRSLAAYNAGPGNVRKWVRKLNGHDDIYFLDRYAIGQTRHYVKTVLNDYLHYRQIWTAENALRDSTP